MTDNFKEIGSLFGREGAGAGFAKQMDKYRIPLLKVLLRKQVAHRRKPHAYSRSRAIWHPGATRSVPQDLLLEHPQ